MESLFDRARKAADRTDLLIPVDDLTVFCMLASEAAQLAANDPADGLLLITDGYTADRVKRVEAARSVAERVLVFGERPTGWLEAPSLSVCPTAGACLPSDRFLILFSSRMNLALVGEANEPAGTEGEAEFRGCWTAARPQVKHLAETLLRSAEGITLPVFALLDPNAAERMQAHSLRLTALLAEHLTSLRHSTAMDKHDLVSVLEILKAISAKRRSHDVLFVFVEQIARVIGATRCSVVRVWGSEDNGHVLASHEDESVSDLVIGLDRYPELRRAMETHKKVLVNDTLHHPLTRGFAAELNRAGIRSLVVIPIVLFDANVGSLFLRAARGHKPFSPREISFCEIVAEAASNALERAHLFESIQRANERLERLAITDGLTGLYNHRHFRERLEDEFERAKRYALPLSCLLLDIDNFKQINDTLGHLQGDAVLREMASRILKTTRKIDVAARYGGEEFVILMPQTDREGARSQGQRLLEDLRRPYKGLPKDRNVTVSIGIAVQEHGVMKDPDAMLRTADSALYEAKKQGKNRAVVGTAKGPP